MKIIVLWDVALCGPVDIYQRSLGTYYLYPQDRMRSSILKMEVETSEAVVNIVAI
jgi:hypothetical protein